MIDLARTLVIGGSGMVGSQVPFGVKPAHTELDITDASSVERAFAARRPSAVLLLAGMIDVKRCEDDPEGAERANARGAEHVARAAAAAAVPLVYFSSCMVFDGKKSQPYTEEDHPNPLTVYGKTKRRGEETVLRLAPRSLVVRTGWLFGGFEKDTKFIRRFRDMLSRGETIRATNDRFGSPTYVPDLISETVRLLQEGESGIFHVVNDGIASYYDVAREIKKLLPDSGEVTGVSQRELNPNEAPRGAMEGLVSSRGVSLRSYAEALAEYIRALGPPNSR